MPKFDVTERDGETYVRYTCPGCKHEHSVPAQRWNWNGSVDSPTLSPSVRHYHARPDGEPGEVTTCHYFIKEGMIQFCDDCQHDLSGQTIELPPCHGTETVELPDIAVIHGDCREVVPAMGAFDFVFADPPFNIGHGYNGYDDNQDAEEFAEFTRDWMATCWGACDGIMAVHGPDHMTEMYLQNARDLGMHRRIAWVNWHYRFGQCNRSNWIDARCHCLVYAKHESWTWNPDAVLVDSDRATTYNDPRINETENGGKRLPGTVWGIPSDGPFWGRVQGNSKERRHGHPNQLPEKYLERLLLAYTNPGDRVLDPFAGSGTTAVVAQALGRRCVMIDVSESNVNSVRERIEKGAVRV